MDTAILLELEQAELAARDRRLAAELEAGRIVAEARADAAATAAGVALRIERTLVLRRRRHQAQARREIAAIQAEIAALDHVDTEAPGAGESVLDQAVALVIAAVLDEEREDRP